MSDEARMKKIARELAETAVGAEKQADMQAVMSNPYLQNALLGAGAGGLLGLATGKNKRRAALDYALMGGLGGLGATAAKEMLFKPSTPPPAVAKAVGEDGSVAGPIAGIGAMGAGAYGGHKLHNAIDQYGKLDRVMKDNKGINAALSPLRSVLDRGAADKEYQTLKGLLGDKQFASLAAMHRHGRPSNAFGFGRGPAANMLAEAGELVAPATTKAITGTQLQNALARLPKGRGRFILPAIGAAAVPALWNAMTAAKSE